MISRGVTIEKTHDLGLLAEMLQEYTEVDEKYLEICDDLTPYGVKIRYPQELYDWLLTLLQAEKMNLDAIEEQEDSGEGNYS